MPHRTRAWIWAGRAAAAAAVIGLAGYLFAVGLDQAGRLAAPVGLVIALAALFAPYLLPVYQPAVPPPSDPAPPGPASGAQPRPSTPTKLIVATGGSVAAERIDHLRYYQAPPRPVTWPVLVGQIPVLASAFQDRPGLRDQVKAARKRASGVVLTQVLAGGGGVGKSQLAASYADQAVRAGTDLVVWVTAARAEAAVAAYAQAAARVQASGADGADAETDARAFMDWLAATQHSWLVVLDDITDPGYMERWWPNSHPGTGWVLATTRRHDAKLSGGGRAVLDIGVYTPDESAAYLRDRLTGAGLPSPLSQDAERLAAELGSLPLALSHAAAYMINQQLSCDEYLALFTGRSSRLTEVMPADADAESYGRQIDVTLLLAVDAAQAADPAGLTLPALRLAAVLDPAGHPDILWASPAVTRYLATHRTRVASLQPEPRARPGIIRRFLKYHHPCDLRVRSTATKINMRVNARRAPSVEAGQDFDAVTPTQARAALLLLHRYGLANCGEQGGFRTVRIHAMTARAVREATAAAEVADAARAGAEALLAVWPDPDHTAGDLPGVLRANTDVLATHAGNVLWHRGGHPVLYRSGNSLLAAGLYTAAISHWQRLAADSARVLGPEHPHTIAAKESLATSYWQAGNPATARDLYASLLPIRERLSGPNHVDTAALRANLAKLTGESGDKVAADVLFAGLLRAVARIPGHEHPAGSAIAHSNLTLYTGQPGDAATARDRYSALLPVCELMPGPEHPETLSVRANIAHWTGEAGNATAARDGFSALLPVSERVLGTEHPDTLSFRAGLAHWTGKAGNAAAARDLYAALLPIRERVSGAAHPDTRAASDGLDRWTDEAARGA